MKNIAIYPGTFDPITNGHLDIMRRAARIFDKIVIGVAPNHPKGPLFPVEERIELIRENVTDINAEVRSFEGLVVDFARDVGAIALIRGLRAVSDFEYEFQMTQMNRDLDDGIETIFFMPGARYFFTSSNLIKQVAYYNASRIEKFIPANVAKALHKRYRQSEES
ncbi:MAG: pantetheine-phosphate adenylyltransferase [Opitutales bacterium]|nr:pantetheine-phosphate adenylyltransferase [Opitutales bacterium]